MEVRTNRFTPGFGEYPAVLVGQTALLTKFERALEVRTHPYRRAVVRDAQGSGKTVLLDSVQDVASARGWLVVQQDAGTRTTQLGERVIEDCRKLVADLTPPGRRTTGANVSAFGVGVGADWDQPVEAGLVTVRSALESVLRGCDCSGVLVTVDEVHKASHDEIHELGNAVQHLIRDGYSVAFLGAGLPSTADDEPTFLRRCEPVNLDRTTRDEIRAGLADTAALGGWYFAPEALDRAAEAAGGLPYMMQLVGFEAIEQAAESGVDRIGDVAVGAAIERALPKLANAVSAKLDVSEQEFRFMLAMAVDDGTSTTGDVGTRLSRSPQHVGVYRKRLIDKGLIEAIDHGRVDYVKPWMRALIRSLPPYRPFRQQVAPRVEPGRGYRLDASVAPPARER